MKATLRTIYALLVLSILFVLAITPFNPVEAATAGQAIAAGQRAMNGFDPVRREWIRTLKPQDQRAVMCAQLYRDNDTDGVLALDCSAAEDYLTWNKVAILRASWDRYNALFGRIVPTANDMARAAPKDRHAINEAIWCRQVRDKIAAQVYLMKSGSTGYWNLQSLQAAEMGVCHENMDVTQL